MAKEASEAVRRYGAAVGSCVGARVRLRHPTLRLSHALAAHTPSTRRARRSRRRPPLPRVLRPRHRGRRRWAPNPCMPRVDATRFLWPTRKCPPLSVTGTANPSPAALNLCSVVGPAPDPFCIFSARLRIATPADRCGVLPPSKGAAQRPPSIRGGQSPQRRRRRTNRPARA